LAVSLSVLNHERKLQNEYPLRSHSH
jgi:hypothetical protein